MYVVDTEFFKSGTVVTIADQVAVHAIASGEAVPNDSAVFGEPTPVTEIVAAAQAAKPTVTAAPARAAPAAKTPSAPK
jgi:fructose-specific component phosphotransferase system IIB-like protein